MRVEVGMSAPVVTYGPLTRTDIVRYAGASNDFNPVHHDETFARAAGYPGVLAHGMLSAGLLASFITAWFGPGSVRRFRVRFREIVWPGDQLRAEGVVTAVASAPKPGEPPLAELDLTLRNQHGVPVVTGNATVALAE